MTHRSSFTSLLTPFLAINAIALLLASIWLRCQSLGNIPGVNGDEAWYGVQAWWMLHGGSVGSWQTPTGNPLNPLFLGPLALLHAWLPPSIVLLRSVAVASGLAALAIQWKMCRWVFDRPTAAIATVALAVLPIDIAYSRFAWDASQSLAVTLPVLYFSLAAVRFPERFGRWIAAACLAQAVALWVHPTNVFAGAAIVAVSWVHFRRTDILVCQNRNNSWLDTNPKRKRGIDNGLPSLARRVGMSRTDKNVGPPENATDRNVCPPAINKMVSIAIFLMAGLVLAAWLWAAWPLAGRVAQRVNNGVNLAEAAYLYPRLFTGGTIYRYIAGSRSWFEWPLAPDADGLGLDVVVFWTCIVASAWLLWRSNRIDRAILATWAITLVSFLLIGGPHAMAPGWERFAISLIAPTVLLLARGAALVVRQPIDDMFWVPCLLSERSERSKHVRRRLMPTASVGHGTRTSQIQVGAPLAWEAASSRQRCALAAAALAAWLPLADFQSHYFHFIERTGGEAHATFRTAKVEPKLAALQAVLRESGRRPTDSPELWIVASSWWNRLPIRYLALNHSDVHVPEPGALAPGYPGLFINTKSRSGVPPLLPRMRRDAASTAFMNNSDYRRALKEGRVWFVEFSGTDAANQAMQLPGQGLARQQIFDFAGRPILDIVHPLPPAQSPHSLPPPARE